MHCCQHATDSTSAAACTAASMRQIAQVQQHDVNKMSLYSLFFLAEATPLRNMLARALVLTPHSPRHSSPYSSHHTHRIHWSLSSSDLWSSMSFVELNGLCGAQWALCSSMSFVELIELCGAHWALWSSLSSTKPCTIVTLSRFWRKQQTTISHLSIVPVASLFSQFGLFCCLIAYVELL